MPPAPPDSPVGRASGPVGGARRNRTSRVSQVGGGPSPLSPQRSGRPAKGPTGASRSGALEALLVDLGSQIQSARLSRRAGEAWRRPRAPSRRCSPIWAPRSAVVSPMRPPRRSLQTPPWACFHATGLDALDRASRRRLSRWSPERDLRRRRLSTRIRSSRPALSAGRPLALGLLAETLARGVLVAWVDLADAFDPTSAARRSSPGAARRRTSTELLWVRARSGARPCAAATGCSRPRASSWSSSISCARQARTGGTRHSAIKDVTWLTAGEPARRGHPHGAGRALARTADGLPGRAGPRDAGPACPLRRPPRACSKRSRPRPSCGAIAAARPARGSRSPFTWRGAPKTWERDSLEPRAPPKRRPFFPAPGEALRIACLLVPDLPLHAELRASPELRGQPAGHHERPGRASRDPRRLAGRPRRSGVRRGRRCPRPARSVPRSRCASPRRCSNARRARHCSMSPSRSPRAPSSRSAARGSSLRRAPSISMPAESRRSTQASSRFASMLHARAERAGIRGFVDPRLFARRRATRRTPSRPRPSPRSASRSKHPAPVGRRRRPNDASCPRTRDRLPLAAPHRPARPRRPHGPGPHALRRPSHPRPAAPAPPRPRRAPRPRTARARRPSAGEESRAAAPRASHDLDRRGRGSRGTDREPRAPGLRAARARLAPGRTTDVACARLHSAPTGDAARGRREASLQDRCRHALSGRTRPAATAAARPRTRSARGPVEGVVLHSARACPCGASSSTSSCPAARARASSTRPSPSSGSICGSDRVGAPDIVDDHRPMPSP